jgi:hypothetical protein
MQVIQFVFIRVNMLLFTTQRLAAQQYFDSTLTFTATLTPLGSYNPQQPTFLTRVAANLNATLLEYDAMM